MLDSSLIIAGSSLFAFAVNLGFQGVRQSRLKARIKETEELHNKTVWDIKLNGASRRQCEDYARKLRDCPIPGAVFIVHDENEEWERLDNAKIRIHNDRESWGTDTYPSLPLQVGYDNGIEITAIAPDGEKLFQYGWTTQQVMNRQARWMDHLGNQYELMPDGLLHRVSKPEPPAVSTPLSDILDKLESEGIAVSSGAITATSHPRSWFERGSNNSNIDTKSKSISKLCVGQALIVLFMGVVTGVEIFHLVHPYIQIFPGLHFQ